MSRSFCWYFNCPETVTVKPERRINRYQSATYLFRSLQSKGIWHIKHQRNIFIQVFSCVADIKKTRPTTIANIISNILKNWCRLAGYQPAVKGQDQSTENETWQRIQTRSKVCVNVRIMCRSTTCNSC